MVKLYIKNMVCNRCIMVVESELKKFGLQPLSVQLGEVELESELTEVEKAELEKKLQSLGFDLMSDKKSRLIEGIKKSIIELVRHQEELPKTTVSQYLSEKLGQDYSSLSNLFSESQGITLNQYYITQRIERVKELLVYDELSLSEISDVLDYSSVSHLSKQFKKVTGHTPTQFKKLKGTKRLPIDRL